MKTEYDRQMARRLIQVGQLYEAGDSRFRVVGINEFHAGALCKLEQFKNQEGEWVSPAFLSDLQPSLRALSAFDENSVLI